MNSTLYSLANTLGQLLSTQNLIVTSAESCTAGGVAKAITEVPGSSAWFEAAFVTYSNEMKNRLLNVDNDLLRNFGAVSKEVVSAMLAGALKISTADLGVAVSGIAGPGGATEDKAVGTVCFAWGGLEQVETVTCHFAGDRTAVREQATVKALQFLIEYLRVSVADK